ncbi:MAG: serine proteinase [Oscillospiraceae bacterium]|nr:serine proteinase [Oscillospiraceae bacterium]
MSIDFESLKDKAVVAAQTGVTRVKELTETGVAKAKELADTGAAKAKEITEIGKLKVNNSAEQEAIRKAYSELGKLYYAERGSAPEAAYADACQRITDSLARISYNNERIADIKAAGQLSDSEVEAAEVEPEPVCEEPSCCCGGEEKDEGPCCCCEQDEDKPQE